MATHITISWPNRNEPNLTNVDPRITSLKLQNVHGWREDDVLRFGAILNSKPNLEILQFERSLFKGSKFASQAMVDNHFLSDTRMRALRQLELDIRSLRLLSPKFLQAVSESKLERLNFNCNGRLYYRCQAEKLVQLIPQLKIKVLVFASNMPRGMRDHLLKSLASNYSVQRYEFPQGFLTANEMA